MSLQLQDWNLLDIHDPKVRAWLDHFGVEKWLSQYGLEKCPRCGQIGLHFKSCKFYTPDHGKAFIVAGWVHTKVDTHLLFDVVGSDDDEGQRLGYLTGFDLLRPVTGTVHLRHPSLLDGLAVSAQSP